ncbi:MAG: hypothetical protein K9L21_02760 [Spirochaetia bacterium]|nr:hypothetical protein [Spirochaetia bacterium]
MTVEAASSGRVCLLGDNTDLLGKPAIAASISSYLTCQIETRKDRTISTYSSNLEERTEFSLDSPVPLVGPLRYIHAVVSHFLPKLETGLDIKISSQIPVSAGLSSSTALCIAVIKALLQITDTRMSTAEIAETAYTIESRTLGVECGRLDQYAIAYGGITYIETNENAAAHQLETVNLPILVADTEEKHDTTKLQIWLKKRISQGEPLILESLGRVVSIVEEGRTAILSGNAAKLGQLMNDQQREEKQMGTSTRRLEHLCSVARSAGALGAKQMGAGGGGCIIALCKKEDQSSINKALSSAGAPVWEFDISNPFKKTD